ncbi:hypothetical protein GCM10008959_39490 [Deinococcus seoulensis]|uniref:Uncharacterized protein n=1 Tax=Deinococcus seoulensis TaxID=1837379 RepID=A0ABQ2RX08_9DEIO|nr:DUF6065 family protein [Deinococcus seoulensis]GGR74342.1 hypothetical protein GCM10008959_39490 [Deinococcus seoulensis]
MSTEIIVTAYPLGSADLMPIIVAPTQRVWMNETNKRFAYRCLPLAIANQHGWFVLNSHRIEVTWNGGSEPQDVQIKRLAGPRTNTLPVHSQLGYGILTWQIPYLFRTPPHMNLMVRGPTNMPKDGVSALDGIVETDWAVAPFTMNWQMTRSDNPVIFDIGEPICMIFPVPRGLIEAVVPQFQPLESAPDTHNAFHTWADVRARAQLALQEGKEPSEGEWQKHYMRGHLPDGTVPADHARKLTLRPFTVESSSDS